MRLAYIAQGKLNLIETTGKPRLIESRFAQDFINRSVQVAQRRAWKSGGAQGIWQGSNLWNVKDDFDPGAVKINFSDACAGGTPDEILYCLRTEQVSGMFRYGLATDNEVRLFHKNEFELHDIDRHPEKDAVVAALAKQDGTSNLILFEADSPHYRELTEGDSRDEAPHWSAHDDGRLLYQSAGVARNTRGYCVGYGPSAIMQLDMRSGELATLAELPGHDLLQPRSGADGDVFFIRRPWLAEPWRQGYLLRSLADFALFPFRLLRAFIDYLNVFSMMYSRKPLKTAGGPRLPEQDVARAMLRGHMLNVQKALDRYQQGGETPALVPRSWQLVRRDRDGSETVIADRVSAFDVGAGGDIVYTNGTGIFRIAGPAAKAECMGRDWLVEKVIAL